MEIHSLAIETTSTTQDVVSAEDATAAEVEIDPRRRLEQKCYRIGLRRAHRSFDLEAEDKTLKALEAKASAVALSTARPPSEANERRKTQRLKAAEADLKTRTAARDRSRSVAQARRQDLAALGPRRPRPSISAALRMAATLGLAISIAPTLHDLFVGLDPFLKWLAGGICAWAIGLLIVHGLLPPDDGDSPPQGAQS